MAYQASGPFNPGTSVAQIAAGTTSGLASMLQQTASAVNATLTWTSFTPTLTAATSNPSALWTTKAGYYAQVNKLVFWRMQLQPSSVGGVGSGVYFLNLPVAASATSLNADVCGSATYALNSGAVTTGVCRIYTGLAKFSVVWGPNSAASSTVVWANGSPTLTAGDIYTFEGMYEGA